MIDIGSEQEEFFSVVGIFFLNTAKKNFIPQINNERLIMHCVSELSILNPLKSL